MKLTPLPLRFYRRDAETVARELLGKRLCHRLEDGRLLTGSIVETEAYLGEKDRASHAWNGRRTARTETMYGDGGVAYVYLIYGLYYCLNVVAGHAGDADAVLIRALKSDIEHNEWKERFPRLKPPQWLSGPGRLCRAMQIDKSYNGLSLRSDRLWIAGGDDVASADIVSSPRIGIDYAGEAVDWPLRFYQRDEVAVSGRR